MKIVKKLIKFEIILIIFLIVVYIGIYVYAKMSNKLNIKSANSYSIYDSSGEIFYGYNNNRIDLSGISNNLINATISIEYKNFYNHIGFDYLRILKALYVNAKNGENSQGASTISQQYAKNLFLDFDKTWERKIEEAWLIINLETHYSKDEILEGYLNTINYGGFMGLRTLVITILVSVQANCHYLKHLCWLVFLNLLVIIPRLRILIMQKAGNL